MRAQSAAPEGHLAATSGGRINSSGNAESIAIPELPPHVLGILEREGVTNLTTWRKLGRRRLQIFGITKATAKKIDKAAQEAKR